MSESLLLPNTTQIPHVITDEWMSHLSGAEFKVVMYVARRTYGFGKSSDEISIKQMVEGIVKQDGTRLDGGTGLGRATVFRACASLEEKRVLEKGRNSDPKKGDTANTWTLNLARKSKKSAGVPGSQNETPPGSQNETGRVPKRDPQNQVRQNQVTSRRDADASPEGKPNWFKVFCDRANEMGLVVTPEDRDKAPGHLKWVSDKRDATTVEMSRIVLFMVEARLRNHPMSPQEALNKVRGVPSRGHLSAVSGKPSVAVIGATEADYYAGSY